MSQFLSRVDKTTTRSYLEIKFNPETFDVSEMNLVVLTGVKGTGDSKDKKRLENEEHVAFHFNYEISGIDEVAAFAVPFKARKLMR